MSEECPICYDDKFCIKGMCGHHICVDCYEGLSDTVVDFPTVLLVFDGIIHNEGLSLKKKKCPLCRGDYNGLNEVWFMECVEAKECVGSLSWKFFKSLYQEDTVERQDEYYEWKGDVIRESIDEYVTGMCKEGLNEFLSSYGFGKALVDYTDEYGLDGLPKGELKLERCLVFHKIHTFLREFL